MGRGNSQADQASTTANQNAQTYSGNAGSLFSTLAPTLMTEAAHPAGMSPTDIANADTASMQSEGGSGAAAQGLGALHSARTRNAGGSDAAIEASTRGAGERLSGDVLTTRLKNAALKQQQQQEGVAGLEGLFGANVSGGTGSLGAVASNVNANTNAENASWDWSKDLLAPILGAAAQGAGAYTKLNHNQTVK